MPDFSNYTDAELIEFMIRGNEKAFTELYGRKYHPIFRFAFHMSGSKTLAEDATQEVFLALIQQARKFDPTKGTPSAFLFGIARKQVLRLLQKSTAPAQMTNLPDEQEGKKIAEILISHEDPLREVLRGKTIGVVRNAILSLPTKYREAIVFCDLHEFSYEEAATMIQTRVGTIRSRLHRARGLLLQKLLANESISETAEGGKFYELSTL